MENISTLLEEHTSKYRLYNLALLQEPDIPMSPNKNANSRSENPRRDQLPSLFQVSKNNSLRDYQAFHGRSDITNPSIKL